MGTSNDVGGNKSVTHTLTGICPRANSSVDCTGFTTNHHGDVATTDVLAADQADFSRLGHGISRFDGRDHATGFDHAQGNALHRACSGSGVGHRLGNAAATSRARRCASAGGGGAASGGRGCWGGCRSRGGRSSGRRRGGHGVHINGLVRCSTAAGGAATGCGGRGGHGEKGVEAERKRRKEGRLPIRPDSSDR